jgi:hypothetical protein
MFGLTSPKISLNLDSLMLTKHHTKSNLEHKLYIFIIYKIKIYIKLYLPLAL